LRGGLITDCDKASGDFRQLLAGKSAFHVARLQGLIAPAKYETKPWFNPLNVELNLICHLLILLRDLTFMGPCIVSIFQYIYNKILRYTVYLYLETALYVSDGTFTHHQERIKLYLQYLVFVTPLVLSAAIVVELELV
jgi:hypothetical protein